MCVVPSYLYTWLFQYTVDHIPKNLLGNLHDHTVESVSR